MNPIRTIRRVAVLLAGLGGAVLASIITATAAFATLPPLPGTDTHPAPAPAQVHVVQAGGMPGWQISLIAVGAAILAAAIAVLLDRAWGARRHMTARTA
jgi:hypothetical protein